MKLKRLVIGGSLASFFSYACVFPKKEAKFRIKKISINKNSKSVKLESIEYKIITDKNSVREYATINLKIPNDVTKAARPCRMTLGIHVMSGILEVKGLATLKEMKTLREENINYKRNILCILIHNLSLFD